MFGLSFFFSFQNSAFLYSFPLHPTTELHVSLMLSCQVQDEYLDRPCESELPVCILGLESRVPSTCSPGSGKGEEMFADPLLGEVFAGLLLGEVFADFCCWGGVC